MKNLLSYSLLSSLLILLSCSKNDEVILPDDDKLAIEVRGISVSTNPAIGVTSRTATSGGNVSNGGNVTEKGICYNTSPNPNISNFKIIGGSGNGQYTCVLYNLTGNTTYYVRAYAIKNGNVIYGNQITFISLTDYGAVTDIDGNIYQTIHIGNQIWMLENLKTTKYRDGSSIDHVPDSLQWNALTSGAFCNYKNDPSNVSNYGRLYNWYAATDARNVAPPGFHVPTIADWNSMVNYLGGTSTAGGKLKETGTAHWYPENVATNSAAFNALPAGNRWANPFNDPCVFTGLGYRAAWWSTSTYTDPAYAQYVEVINSDDDVRGSIGSFSGIGNISFNKKTGYGIRCVKD